MEKLDLKLIEMRAQASGADTSSSSSCYGAIPPVLDPLGESAISDGHSLVGVANVFLACLFHDVAFDYHTPIISQQGAVAGRLRVQVRKNSRKSNNFEYFVVSSVANRSNAFAAPSHSTVPQNR